MNEKVKHGIKKFIANFKITPVAVIALSFLGVILIGSILLITPFAYSEEYLASLNGGYPSYIDALFTATTSTCVTGLVSVVDGIGSTYSLFGYIVIGTLIQIGGLGVSTFAVFFAMLLSSKLSFGNQTLVKESWNLKSFKSVRKVFWLVILITFVIEGIGATIFTLNFYFNPFYDSYNFTILESIGYGVFTSISAFNNAGIDLFGSTSLINFANDYVLTITIIFLIILGGIGFFVIIDIIGKGFHFSKFNVHTKVVLLYTAVLLVLGTLGIYLAELGNVSNTSFYGAFFMSVSTRTAGFTLYDLSTYREATCLIMCVLMFIGASPGGTGGGIKTTTFAVLFAYFRSLIGGRNPSLFRRRMSDDVVKKALFILILGVSLFMFGIFFISIFEINNTASADYALIDYMVEAMSAFGTVGLSTGFTPYSSIGSKIVLILLMYIGRIGPISISAMVRRKNSITFDYVIEDVRVG